MKTPQIKYVVQELDPSSKRRIGRSRRVIASNPPRAVHKVDAATYLKNIVRVNGPYCKSTADKPILYATNSRLFEVYRCPRS